MSSSIDLYKQSLTLLTDLYQLTMAYAYWKSGVGRKEAVFTLFYRRNPFGGGFSIACGLGYAIDMVANFRFDASDVEYLAELRGTDSKPLFEPAFFEYLLELRLKCDIDAIPEGTVVFPHEPLVRVQGPLIHCQLLETPLLNCINFQTLIATKASRICRAAQSNPVLEFGLRRAHGFDGGLAVSRAAYVGGCASTSNVLAGKMFGIPVRGTHAHSWVMAFDDELEAFQAYADVMPNNCILLVDTYNSLEGVRKAVQVGKTLRERGHELGGIRLDSGDLAYLSIRARQILDEAGFPDAEIVGSNDLDEHIISSLKNQGAKISVWGVGTKLSTAFDQPAIGGVYKLTALREPGRRWEYKTKISEQSIKTTTPGIQQVRRYRSETEFISDVIYDIKIGLEDGCTMVDPMDMTRQKTIPTETEFNDLLVPIFRQGRCVYDAPAIHEMRDCATRQLAMFHDGIKRFSNPHEYPVGLEKRLFELRTKQILKARGVTS